MRHIEGRSGIVRDDRAGLLADRGASGKVRGQGWYATQAGRGSLVSAREPSGSGTFYVGSPLV
eukprot:9307897-Lingulodinium_polyedra.AAC.1